MKTSRILLRLSLVLSMALCASSFQKERPLSLQSQRTVQSRKFEKDAALKIAHGGDSSPKALPLVERRKWLQSVPFKKNVAFVISSILVAVALAVSSPTSALIGSEARRLGWRNLSSSAILLFCLGGLPLSLSLGFGSFVQTLLVSASRCALQVSLLGGIVLQRMMGVKRPIYVAAWILGVGLIAGREALSRIQYSYPKMNRNLYVSMLTGGISVLGLAITLQLFGAVEPWFDPRVWIPIAGMLFGNTLNACALALSTITNQFVISSESIEARLMKGATVREAIHPLLEESYKLSLMPTINSLAATGIIHIPGMMSGQILAGQSPQQAGFYQIVISFLIATTAFATVQLTIGSSVRALVDKRESRLRSGVLTTKKNKSSTPLLPFLKSIFSIGSSDAKDATKTSSQASPEPSFHSISDNFQRLEGDMADPPVLTIENLHVPRARTIVNLSLHPGDRVAITGKSGAGKTQILRSIIGLEKTIGTGHVSLGNTPTTKENLPSFRSRVSLVAQNNLMLEGTPNEFFQQILLYQSRPDQEFRPMSTGGDAIHPSEIAKAWNLKPGTFDQPWRTLSGGESQRVALAISLALKPDVLLLDESTGALDETTCLLVERTLKESKIPIIIVTHSEDQLNRFCTRQLKLP